MLKFLLWLLLLVVCWPLAVLALVLYPIVWILLLPFRLLGIAVDGVLELIDPDLLAANKRIINLGMELMGARTLQRLAAENDVRGHNTAAARNYGKSVAEQGLKATLRARDEKFGDGRARVNGPELRDAQGKLIDR